MSDQELQYAPFLKGEFIYLIVLSEEIAKRSMWYSWFNDEENTKYMQKHYFPNTKEDQVRFFKNAIEGSNNKLQLGIYHVADKILIGTISLTNIDHINRKCEIGGIIGEAKYKSIKYWLEANRLIINHATNSLNLRRIYGGAIAKEISQFYERLLGFKAEGVLRQDVFKNGSFRDVYIFAKTYV